MINLFIQFYRSLPKFKGKLRLAKQFFPNTIESLGLELYLTGIYDKRAVDFLSCQIKSGDVYFDIGANIGSLGLPVVKQKSGVKYYGFEASPWVFNYLEKNFSDNKITNYQLYNYAVHANDRQPMQFYQSAHFGKSSLAPTYTQDYILVNSISLDSFCADKQILHINWIKIDVQGFELFVFKGMEQLLQNKQVYNILFEFEYWAEADAGLEKGAAQDYLKTMGYSLFDMNGTSLSDTMREGRAMIWGRPMGK
jgi:FkbM family methyltransferase